MSNFYFYNCEKIRSFGRYMVYCGITKFFERFKWKGKNYVIEVRLKEVKTKGVFEDEF